MRYLKSPVGIFELSAGLIALVGIVIFGLPSPETRPKIYELYLAGVWGLMALSVTKSYWNWTATHWSRKLLAIVAPLVSLLYLLKYFWS